MSVVGDLVFVGDVHLEEGDPALDDFLRFLDRLSKTAGRVVFAGDLFNLWIGKRELELSHQRGVLSRFEAMRRKGIVIRYLEGNRDYRVSRAYVGTALDEATDRGIVEELAGRRIFAIHGDLANVEDRQYRTWRRVSRSGLLWAVFHALPRSRRLALAQSLERRMRATNLEYKREFPEDAVRRYAAGFLADGHDAVVLGHFHVEKDLAALPPSPPGRILVLPEWKGSRRHLRVGPEGELAFVDSER